MGLDRNGCAIYPSSKFQFYSSIGCQVRSAVRLLQTGKKINRKIYLKIEPLYKMKMRWKTSKKKRIYIYYEKTK